MTMVPVHRRDAETQRRRDAETQRRRDAETQRGREKTLFMSLSQRWTHHRDTEGTEKTFVRRTSVYPACSLSPFIRVRLW
jgi:hypothetical protein